jgi:transcriptional regulator, propionate catabolism operon regulatory protein
MERESCFGGGLSTVPAGSPTSGPSLWKPRIVILICHLRMVVPPSKLAIEARATLPAYSACADISIFDVPIADAVRFGKDLEQRAEVDLFICTGATGAYLQKHVRSPVVLIPVSDYDILQALEVARRTTSTVAVLSYREVNRKLEAVQPLLTVTVKQSAYTTLQEAEECVAAMAATGCKVVVGSSMITEIAEKAGIHSVLATSGNAVREALDDAMAILRASHAETAKREHLNALLKQLGDGVAAIDLAGRIQSINPAMARLLNMTPSQAEGQLLADVEPRLDPQHMASEQGAQEGKIVHLGMRSVLATLTPIVEHGNPSGAVLVCQDTSAVQRAERQIRSSSRTTRFTAKYRLSQVIATSDAMLLPLDLARRYALTDSTVLINGESGTGKELIAQGMHNASRRANGPFVAINCASFPETLLESELFGYEEGAFSGTRKGGKPGLFELAHTGTIFLDEIGDMPMSLQTRLLRVLQEREVVRLGGTEPTPVDVRIIAATHRNLRTLIAENRFREDLYYRINILRISLPALRERREDIAPLAVTILEEAARRHRLDGVPAGWLEPLLPYLECYSWQGNVRELENVLERLVLVMMSGDGPDLEDPVQLRAVVRSILDEDAAIALDCASTEGNLKAMAKSTELMMILKVVNECGGSLEHASRRLGISRTTIWRRLNTRTPAEAGGK